MTGNAEQRQRVVAEAVSWLRTPWRHQAEVKGAGVDCGKLIAKVFENTGLLVVPKLSAEDKNYPRQWMLHKDDEVFLYWTEQFFRPVDEPLPADIAVWKVGRTYSHGAIVVAWPTIIHADVHEGVVLADASVGQLAGRDKQFYSVFMESA